MRPFYKKTTRITALFIFLLFSQTQLSHASEQTTEIEIETLSSNAVDFSITSYSEEETPVGYNLSLCSDSKLSCIDKNSFESLNDYTPQDFIQIDGLEAAQCYRIMVCSQSINDSDDKASIPYSKIFYTLEDNTPETAAYYSSSSSPPSLSLSSVSYTRATLRWANNDPSVNNFRISISEGSLARSCVGGRYVNSGISSTQDYTFTSLKENTVYTASLCRNFTDGGSDHSGSTLTFRTEAFPKPSPAYSLQVNKRTDSEIAFSWVRPADALDTLIFVRANHQSLASCYGLTGAIVSKGNSFVHKGIPQNVKRSYILCTRNAYGGLSTPVHIHTSTRAAYAPQSVGSVRTSNLTPRSVILRWNANTDNAAGYVATLVKGTQQLRCADKSRGFGKVSTNYWVQKNLEPDTEYSFMICARNHHLTHYSNPVVLHFKTPALQIPQAPQNLRITSRGVRDMSLEWDAPLSAVNGYKIVFAKGEDAPDCNAGRAKRLSANATSYIAKNLKPNQNVSVALCSVGDYNYISEKATVSDVLSAPIQPSGLKIKSRSLRGLELEWDASSDPNTIAYRFSYAAGTNIPSCTDRNSIRVSAPRTTFTKLNLAANRNYTYVICSEAQFNVLSSPVLVADTVLNPESPKNLAIVSETPRSISVEWDSLENDENVLALKVFFVFKGNSFDCNSKKGIQLNKSRTSYTRRGLRPKVDYTLVLCAIGKYQTVSEASYVFKD